MPKSIIYYNGGSLANIDFTKADVAIYESIFVKSATDPTLYEGHANDFSLLSKFVSTAKAANPNIKVMASLVGGGWNQYDKGNLLAIMSNAALSKALASKLAALCVTYKLDGIDIDYEGDDLVPSNYHTFLLYLRTAMGTKLISVCGAGSYTYHPWFAKDAINSYVDWVDVMEYDDSYISMADIQAYFPQWVNSGITLSKLALGIHYLTPIAQVQAEIAYAQSLGITSYSLWCADLDTAGVEGAIYNALNPQPAPPVITITISNPLAAGTYKLTK